MADNTNITEDQESEQFNSMLSAAQKHIGSQEGNSGLTQAQIEAMLAMDDDAEDDDGAGTSGSGTGNAQFSPNGDDDGQEQGASDLDIADRFREGIAADAQAVAAETEEKQKKKKEKKPKVKKEKKEKKPLDKATIAKIATAAAIVVALALGYCVCLLFFTDVIKTEGEEFAIRSANAVNSKLAHGNELYVYRAYVRRGSGQEECMLYAVTSTSSSRKTDMYRVVIYNDEPNKINVYYTLDTDNSEYIKLRDSEDEAKRIQASRLKGYSDDIAAADKEIQINDPAWEKIDCTVINKNITKVQ